MATDKNKSKSSKSKKEDIKVQEKKNIVIDNKIEKKNENQSNTQKITNKQVQEKSKNQIKKQKNVNKNTTNKQLSEKKQNESVKVEKKESEETSKDASEKEMIVEEVSKESNQESKAKQQENIVEKNKDEVKESKELIKLENKEITKKEEKPEYINELIEKSKKAKRLLITVIITAIFFIVFSTIFAISNTNNSKIINGISIRNIDVSNLSKKEAIEKLTVALNKELIAEINLVYEQDYNVSLKPEQIEFIYDINNSVEDAYKEGRTGNILIDNYTIIYTALFGKEYTMDYSYNGELLNAFIEDIRSKLPGIVIDPTYYIENDKIFISKGIDGIEVKKDELKNQIILSIIERNINEISEGFKQNIEIPTEQAKASDIDMVLIKEKIHKEPQNAYFEKNPYKIYPDVEGIDLLILPEEAQAIINQEEKEEYSFDLKITEAEFTVDDLGKEAFPDLISNYSTKYDASNINRSTNLKIAAEKINGKVLMPGEEFSFNQVVGKRTVEAGYKDAAIYADGGVVDGLAGGICQISSTLYNSVLLANLQITERRNHSFTTSYAPAGRDATVVWGTTDFRFINSRTYPIKIEATVSGGIANFKLYGMKEEVEYEVNIIPVRTQSIPYKTTYEEDPSLIPGQQIVRQSGHAGCKVTTYKELKLNGEVVSKEAISNDTYQPMRTIIRVAPGQVPVQ